MSSKPFQVPFIETICKELEDSEDGVVSEDYSIDFSSVSDDPEDHSDDNDFQAVVDLIFGKEDSEKIPTHSTSSTLDEAGLGEILENGIGDMSSLPCKNFSEDKIKLLWRKENLILSQQQISFLGNEALPAEMLNLETPFQIFQYFFPIDLYEKIAEQTNLHIVQKNPSNVFRVSAIEIQQFTGIVFLMSLLKLPRVSRHWSDTIGTPLIKKIMSLNKFEQIHEHIQFNDSTTTLLRTDSNYESLHKIHSIIEILNKNFSKIPLERNLSVHEKIHTTKDKNAIKPHKWEHKLFVLSGVSGFTYKFELKNGKESIQLPEEPDLDASISIAMRLTQIIPRHKNFRVYFDDYFTSLSLVTYLAKDGIQSLGTFRRNRVCDSNFIAEKQLLKKERGYSIEYVCNYEGIDMSIVMWRNKKIVNLISTFAGEVPKSLVNVYDKKNNKKFIQISCPFAFQEYNRHMEILSNISIHNIPLRSKRWCVTLFYYLLDTTMANSWLLYKRIFQNKNLGNELMTSTDFQMEVAQALCKAHMKSDQKERLSSMKRKIQEKKQKEPSQIAPPTHVRKDPVGHWPIWSKKRIRCKFHKCKGVTRTVCEKCNVTLCYNKAKNCFRLFHNS